MKWLFPLIFVLCCVPISKRNAEIIVTYEGIVEAHHNPEYNTETELRETLNDDKSPDFIIFSSPYCGACIDLKHRLKDLDWRDKVIVLNYHEEWVNLIAQYVGITAVPSMIIDKDKGKTKSLIHVGPGEIGRQLYKHLETKK
jgi:thiol-disulfide isomerase/thioredoxin